MPRPLREGDHVRVITGMYRDFSGVVVASDTSDVGMVTVRLAVLDDVILVEMDTTTLIRD